MSIVLRWTQLSRGTRAGSLAGLSLGLLAGSFIVYAGLAIANVVADSVRSTAAHALAPAAGVATLIICVVVVLVVHTLVGGVIGALVERAVKTVTGRGV